ncbi:uncharacterized protein LOC120152374 [Hibiscus syriacus]|uniref:uncharacterized protein LOC120152374 n=1 Tax=Hibiscus syriacus TaxID=106335 RepID=UPI001924F578|nr:uncharacterized protein LOC120152374 [Hibiscus syriacus]
MEALGFFSTTKRLMGTGNKNLWTKPIEGFFKINVDSAFSAQNEVVAIRVVARDHHGMVMGGSTQKLEGTHTAESTEAKAFTEGIRMAIENGRENVIIEGDAISIVNRLTNQNEDLSMLGLLRNEAHALLESSSTFKVHCLN